MVHVIRIHQYGGPEVMKWEPAEVGAPGQGQLRLKQHAVGLNYIDTYHRSALYKLPSLPAVIGMEGAGEVAAVGPGVTDLENGSSPRIVWLRSPPASITRRPAE
jgi:NADPH:quinone reductase